MGFSLRNLDRYGFPSMTHETRTDWAMLLESIFILLSGAGRWSIDGWLAARRTTRDATQPIAE